MSNPLWVIFAKKPMTAVFAGGLFLGGCADFPGRCSLGISHEDCAPAPSAVSQFPNDDAICRSYGFKFGTPDYARCRTAKASIRGETHETINTEWWKNPL